MTLRHADFREVRDGRIGAEVVAQLGITAGGPRRVEHAVERRDRQVVETVRHGSLAGLPDAADELGHTRQRNAFPVPFLEVLRDDRRHAGRDVAAAHIRLLLEYVTDPAAGQPGDEEHEEDGSAAPRDQKTLPQLLGLYGHSVAVYYWPRMRNIPS